MLLEAPLEAFENAIGVIHRGLADINLLEAPRQGAILLEYAAKFLEGGRANAADLARRQHRLEQVGSIHHPARCGPRTNYGVDLVDEQYRVRALAQLIEQRLEAFLEIATVLGTGQQGSQIQGIDHAGSQQIGHLIVDNTFGQTLGDSGLAHTGFAHQQRVVLAPTRQNLRDPLHLQLSTDQRIDPPLAGQFIEIAGVGIQRIA